jgi:transglutaminase-like putative cysteine protease
MDYRVRHRTAYRYLQDASHSCHLAHLMPRATATQDVLEAELALSPPGDRQQQRKDFFGNAVEWFTIDQPHAMLEVIAESRVRVARPGALEPAKSLAWEEVKIALEAGEGAEVRDAVQFCFDSPLVRAGAEIAAYAERSFTPKRPILEAAYGLMERIHGDFRYDTTVTDAATTSDRVFAIRAGVCQDLAHIGLAALRSIGLAGRYVSGYLLTEPPPGQPRLVGADASHAWFSVWAPPFGWVDLDPTNNVRVGEGHITVAWGRDYTDVSPINGIVTGGGDNAVEVAVDVVPV